MATLYNKLGGEPALKAVVDKFYEFMLADPIVNYFFESIDMNKQRQRQFQFLTLVTGGPNIYEGTDMKAAHAKYKIGKKEFDQTWKHLEDSLTFHKVDPALINEVKDIFYSVEKEVETV